MSVNGAGIVVHTAGPTDAIRPTVAWSAIHAMTPRDRIVMAQMRVMIEHNQGNCAAPLLGRRSRRP